MITKTIYSISILLILPLLSFVSFTDKDKKTYFSIVEASKQPRKVIQLELIMENYEEFPMEILAFKKLELLYLRGNQISNIPPAFAELKQLKKLSLGENPIDNFEGLFNTLKDLKKLEELDLEATGIKNIPNSIKNLNNLKTLYINFKNPIDSLEISRVKKILPNLNIR